MTSLINCIIDKELSEKTFFHPWIGEYYFSPNKNMFGKTRILVLGQSHYCKNDEIKDNNCNKNCGAMVLPLEQDGCHLSVNTISQRKRQMGSKNGGLSCNSFTQNVIFAYAYLIENVKTTPWKKDFIRTERYVLGHQADCSNGEFSRFWNSIAYYNYLQTAYKDGGSGKYTNEYNEFDLSKGFLQDVISFLEPDIIIAWGLSAWNSHVKSALKMNGFMLQEGGKLYKKTKDKQYYDVIEGKKYWQDIVVMSSKKTIVLIPPHPSARKMTQEAISGLSKKCSERIKDIFKTMNPTCNISW